MKVTKQQIGELFQKVADQQKLKELLQEIFSYKENIETFSEVLFPKTITNQIPEFHSQIYEFLFEDGNGALAAPRGHAKQLADNTPIITTKGWKLHGDLNVGDYVFSPNGKSVQITAKSEKTSSDYVVKTRDNETIRCSGDHRWVVWDRNIKGMTMLETKDMITNGERSRYLLPLRQPLQFNEKDLIIDPYFLGLWLGDGTSKKPAITHHKEDTDSINSIPYKITARWVHKDTGVITTNFGRQGIVEKLRKLNLYNNKHIPESYLFGSVKQQIELMAGLIDSDGHVDKQRGRIRFVNTNYKLIKDVESLAISLGSRPYITSQKPTTSGKVISKLKVYTVGFDPIITIPTRLSRKKTKRFPNRQRLGIVSVEYNPNGEIGNCIKVDSKDGLYLAGKRLIPTHNTSCTGIIYLIWCIVNEIEEYIVYISQNHAKTVQFIDPIRFEFKQNKMLKFIYGDLTPRPNKDDEGKDREDCFDVGGCRVEAVSFEKNLRGFKYRNMRPTLIIGDDIESDERVLNAELREKDRNKLNKVIIPSLDIKGRFKMIGTLIHLDSLLHNKIKLYKGKVFKACDENLNNILWKDRFTKDILKKIKYDIGSVAFQSEYLNNPVDNTSSLIKREWIEQCRREDISAEDVFKMQFSIKTMGADFAFSDRVSADESAFTGLGKKDGFYYLLNCQKDKGLSINEQMSIMKNELYLKYRYDKMGLEENSIKAISKDISQWKLPITLFWTASSDPAARKKSDYDWTDKRHTVGKINLINRLGTAFENKEFIIPYKTEKDKAIFNKIVAECTSYALSDGKLVEAGAHPDIPIALGYALELMTLGGESAWAFPGKEEKTKDEIHTEIIDGQKVKMIGDRKLVV